MLLGGVQPFILQNRNGSLTSLAVPPDRIGTPLGIDERSTHPSDQGGVNIAV